MLDISTLDALTKTLLAAKSIACSDSDSGAYLTTVLFRKLGIADLIKGKVIEIEATPVAATTEATTTQSETLRSRGCTVRTMKRKQTTSRRKQHRVAEF